MNSENKGRGAFRGFLIQAAGIIEVCYISVFVITLIFVYILKIVTVEGQSMENTLNPGDSLIASAFCIAPKAGDVVIIDADEALLLDENGEVEYNKGLGKQIVKRIIAVAGQTIDIDFSSGIVTVDGVVLNEPYISGLTHLDEGAFSDQYPLTVPEGCVFVMGDNRVVSKDSRSSEIGFVSTDKIVGKILFRISPISDFGFIE